MTIFSLKKIKGYQGKQKLLKVEVASSFLTFLDVLAIGVQHNLTSVENVGALQVQDVVDAGSRTLGLVGSVDDQPCAVAVTLDRDFVPLAVVQL